MVVQMGAALVFDLCDDELNHLRTAKVIVRGAWAHHRRNAASGHHPAIRRYMT